MNMATITASLPTSTAVRTGLYGSRLLRSQPRTARPLLQRGGKVMALKGIRERSKNPDTVKSDKGTRRDRVAEPIDDAVSSPAAYTALALTLTLLATPTLLFPNTAGNFTFGDSTANAALGEALFRIVGSGLSQGAAVAFALKFGAEQDGLNKKPYQRFEIALVLFATLQVLLQLTNVSQAGSRVLTTQAFWASTLVWGLTVLLAWGGFGKDSEGLSLKRAGPLPIVKRFQDDTAGLAESNSATSIGYSVLAASFFAAGASYLLYPESTLQGVFGVSPSGEDVYLWRTAGTALITLVAPSAYSLKEAAQRNKLSAVPYKALAVGLVAGAGVHLAVLAPFFLAGTAGPLAPVVAGTWVAAGVISGAKLLNSDED